MGRRFGLVQVGEDRGPVVEGGVLGPGDVGKKGDLPGVGGDLAQDRRGRDGRRASDIVAERQLICPERRSGAAHMLEVGSRRRRGELTSGGLTVAQIVGDQAELDRLPGGPILRRNLAGIALDDPQCAAQVAQGLFVPAQRLIAAGPVHETDIEIGPKRQGATGGVDAGAVIAADQVQVRHLGPGPGLFLARATRQLQRRRHGVGQTAVFLEILGVAIGLGLRIERFGGARDQAVEILALLRQFLTRVRAGAHGEHQALGRFVEFPADPGLMAQGCSSRGPRVSCNDAVMESDRRPCSSRYLA